MTMSNWIQILAIFLTLLHKMGSNPMTYEEFYIFPSIYLKFFFELGSKSPTELEIVQGYKNASKSPLSIDPDVYNHIRMYEYHANAAISPENDEQRIQEINKIHELCHVALEETNMRTTILFCPSKAIIQPCTCSNSNTGPNLDCSDVNSFIDLKLLLNNATFPTTEFYHFKYYSDSPNAEERVLLNNTFGPLSFERIFIGTSGLVKVQANALSGSENTLKVLLFDNNSNLKEVPFQYILGNFPQLNYFGAYKGSISELPRLESTSITHLYLDTNLISTLQYDTFKNLPNLNTLDISNNEIETIGPRGWYLSSNPYIFIHDNFLTSVAAFSNNQPCIFNAKNNKLTSFNQDVYEPILKLKCAEVWVDVSNNEINCDKMEWAADYPDRVISDC